MNAIDYADFLTRVADFYPDKGKATMLEAAAEMRRLAAVERDAKLLLRLNLDWDYFWNASAFAADKYGGVISLPCEPELPLPDDVRSKLEQIIGGDHAK